MGEFKTTCHLCDKDIIRRPFDDGTWPMFNLDGAIHEHKTIRVSQILSEIHYKDDEDKTKTIGDMTISELEDRIKRISSQEAAKKLGAYLHSIHGFISKGFKEDFIKKKIIVDEDEYYITGKLDSKNEEMFVEAKFFSSRQRMKKNHQYTIDQCDIYGWITGLPKSSLFLHVIDEQKTEEEIHENNLDRGRAIVVDYIENHFPVSNQ